MIGTNKGQGLGDVTI